MNEDQAKAGQSTLLSIKAHLIALKYNQSLAPIDSPNHWLNYHIFDLARPNAKMQTIVAIAMAQAQKIGLFGQNKNCPRPPTHLKALLVVLFFLAIFIGIYILLKNQPESSSHLSTVEKMEKDGAPIFSTATIEGEKVELAEQHGKVVIVNFWASWRGPCIEEIPSLVSLAEHFKDKIQIIAISNDDKLEDIDIFLKSFSKLKATNIKIVWDKDQSLAKLYNVQRLPESYIIGLNRKLEKKIIGSIVWYSPQSIEYIESLNRRK